MAARTALLIFMIDERFGVFSKRAQKHRPPPEKRSPAAGVFVFSFAAFYEKKLKEKGRCERHGGKDGVPRFSAMNETSGDLEFWRYRPDKGRKPLFAPRGRPLLRSETACDFQMIFTACRDNSRCTNRRPRSCTSSSSSSRAARCERRCSGRRCRIRCSAS